MKFEEYLELYKAKYGDQGPSVSSSPTLHKYISFKNCGCWRCAGRRLKKELKQKQQWPKYFP